MNCDFCHAENPTPTHRIPCRSFDVKDVVPVVLPMQSVGDWVACDECYRIIEAGDKEGLIQHALTAFESRWPKETVRIARKNIEAEIRSMYAQFWESRIV